MDEKFYLALDFNWLNTNKTTNFTVPRKGGPCRHATSHLYWKSKKGEYNETTIWYKIIFYMLVKNIGSLVVKGDMIVLSYQ